MRHHGHVRHRRVFHPGAGEQSSAPAAPLRILILGGTAFLGPALVEFARSRGHTITLFNRGRRSRASSRTWRS
ncbi:hypothetical protein QEG98_03155 [Myxococcus sp. MxC21-1]|uniref:hypothetical protein n=1 Tax=Myxococcus sp. MxC21-1 TaxID=3041439 RepID=UPI00292CE6FA|nr:hypothetical protein [Myxococcus sp. MxC21-1]WNZ62831.1 hypothetical protein QEG98_03155 [Myxococcus sp. MxC21-1]